MYVYTINQRNPRKGVNIYNNSDLSLARDEAVSSALTGLGRFRTFVFLGLGYRVSGLGLGICGLGFVWV